MHTTAQIKYLQTLIANPPAPDGVADAVAEFGAILADNQALVQYNNSCPLLIMLVGAWSDNAKKVRRVREYLVPNKKNQDRTHLMSYFGQCLQLVLQHGGDPNIIHQHCHGSTAMHWLIAWDRPLEAVAFLDLIASYATTTLFNPNPPDAVGNTALTLAVIKKYFNRTPQDRIDDSTCIATLVNHNTDVLYKNTHGETALSYAIWKRDRETVQAIFDHYQKNHPHHINTLKHHAQQAWHYSKTLSYEDIAQRLYHLYQASPPEQTIYKPRWDNSKNEFDRFVVDL